MYADIPDDALPHCLVNRELARRVTGLVVLNRSRGVGMEGAEEESMMLMGMDGWMEQPDLGHDEMIGAQQHGCENHTMQQERRRVSPLPLSSSWERRMMDYRARIIENEEKEFTRGFVFSTTTSSSTTSTSSHQGKTNRFMEKVQAEATRKFQEQLTSVAMTA